MPPLARFTRLLEQGYGIANGAPLGERIIVFGRVLDENGAPVPGTLVDPAFDRRGSRRKQPLPGIDRL